MNGNPWLLLTASPPGNLGVGQLYLRSLCRLLPPRSVAVAALLASGEVWSPPGDVEVIDQLRLERRYESAYRPRQGPVGQAAATAGVRFCLEPHARRLTEEAVEWGRERSVGGVIAVLDGPLTMLMSSSLAQQLRVPLHTLVWDAPEHVLERFGHSSWSARHLQRGFDAAVRQSAGVAVLSEAMQDRCAAAYRARCTIVRQPIEDEWKLGPRATARHPREDFVIGFAGSVTARDEVELLCRTLDAENWMIAGRKVRLRVYGLRFVCQGQAARWIDYRGYLPDVADVVAGLSECDVLFLPQPFRAADRAFTEFSFPTKLTTYLAAGRPVLLLAPPWSALTDFCRRHALPIVCDQADPAVLLEHFRRFATDQEHVGDVELRQIAAAEELRPQMMRERVNEWLSAADAGAGEPIAPQRLERTHQTLSA